MVYFLRFKSKLGLADLSTDIADESDHLLDLLMTLENSLKHCVLGDFVCTCLNHNYLFSSTCNCKCEICLSALFKCRIEDNFTVNKTNIYSCDRAIPRDIGD